MGTGQGAGEEGAPSGDGVVVGQHPEHCSVIFWYPAYVFSYSLATVNRCQPVFPMGLQHCPPRGLAFLGDLTPDPQSFQ